MMKKTIKGGNGDPFSNWNLLGDLSFMENAIIKIIKLIPWWIIILILIIVVGIIFVTSEWIIAIGTPIYFIGAIVAMIKSRKTNVNWLWAGAQSWFFVIRH